MSTNSLHHPILVIDDEKDIRDLIGITLRKMDLSVDTAEGVTEALNKLQTNQYSLILTDMRMPDGNGLEIVEYVNAHLDTPIAMITAYGNPDHAVTALKAGAFDYIQKPITLAQLRTLVKSAIKINTIESEPIAKNIANQTKPKDTVGNQTKDTVSNQSKTVSNEKRRLLGHSFLIQEVKNLISKVSKTNVSVYITGESGTGKEQAARSIHEASNRAKEAFIAVNCGAIPENLMESEFFGHKKGSFTGADSDREGFFQAANKGTIFLDEVADLPMNMQVKLLRVIQEKSVRKIGENQETAIDVRIICATHKNLADEQQQGRFRQDLFYRLNVVSLTMPPLRELRDDLPDFIDLIVSKISKEKILISPEAKKQLLQYNYPGNFRELENILERAIALCNNNTISVTDLQIQTEQNSITKTTKEFADNDNKQDFVLGEDNLQDYLDLVEKQVLLQALDTTKYNRTQAAKLLGISFRSIRYRLDRLDIHSSERRDPE